MRPDFSKCDCSYVVWRAGEKVNFDPCDTECMHAEYPAANLSAQTSPDHRRREQLLFYASEAVNLTSIVILDLHTTLYIAKECHHANEVPVYEVILCYSRHALSAMYPGVSL
jgi:hypothetical protein